MVNMSPFARVVFVCVSQSDDDALLGVPHIGTLWNLSSTIQGADEGVAALQKHGKRIVYVSNNAARDADRYEFKFKESNIRATFVSISA